MGLRGLRVVVDQAGEVRGDHGVQEDQAVEVRDDHGVREDAVEEGPVDEVDCREEAVEAEDED
jgi:hypothetical protein